MFGLFLLATAAAFLVVSAVMPWWSLSLYDGGSTVTVQFVPGSEYRAYAANATENLSAWFNYHVDGFGGLAELYELLLAATIGLAVLVGGIVGLGASAEAGWVRRGVRGGALPTIGLLATAAIVTTVVLLTVFQPVQFNASNPEGACTGSAAGTPCNSFWSPSMSPIGTWGPWLGWYFAVTAGGLAGVGVLVWWSARNEPWEEGTMESQIDSLGGARSRRPSPLGTLPPPQRPASDVGPPRPAAPPPSAPRVPISAPSWVPPAAPARPPPAGGSNAPPPRVAPTGRPPSSSPPRAPAPVGPPADLEPTSEVFQIVRWQQSVAAGQLSIEEFAGRKRRLLAEPPPERSPGAGGGSPARDLAALDSLRDLKALTGPEYLQLRRRVLMQK